MHKETARRRERHRIGIGRERWVAGGSTPREMGSQREREAKEELRSERGGVEDWRKD
jgi:hypothetical protein